jgi:hypothetical protein
VSAQPPAFDQRHAHSLRHAAMIVHHQRDGVAGREPFFADVRPLNRARFFDSGELRLVEFSSFADAQLPAQTERH